MRQVLVIALAAAGLCACASDSMKEAAIRQCQTVGITQNDPEFDVCTRSYTLQANQNNLEASYHTALNPTYDNGKIAHQWHGY